MLEPQPRLAIEYHPSLATFAETSGGVDPALESKLFIKEGLQQRELCRGKRRLKSSKSAGQSQSALQVGKNVSNSKSDIYLHTIYATDSSSDSSDVPLEKREDQECKKLKLEEEALWNEALSTKCPSNSPTIVEVTDVEAQDDIQISLSQQDLDKEEEDVKDICQ